MKQISQKTKSLVGADAVVIGGGLAGIFATLRLAKSGLEVLLIDSPIQHEYNALGGFACFSGAKFSLPPAGLGLLSVAGTKDQFSAAITSTLNTLGLMGYDTHDSFEHPLRTESVTIRTYQSILLTPDGIKQLLANLSAAVTSCAGVIRCKATNIRRKKGHWEISIRTQESTSTRTVTASAVFYAAGRLSEGLLLKAGAIPTEGKGLDIGVRLEFTDKRALSELRKLGADAKILHGACRTFCLNSPGKIYQYPFKNISIPGGIVADNSADEANVGILLRVDNKEQRLQKIEQNAKVLRDELVAQSSRLQTDGGYMPKALAKLFGDNEVESLRCFIEELARRGLIDTKQPHRIHMPLLDWHWHTFAAPNSHSTSLPGVYALGDSSGHARGLLQAAISGLLAAEEYLCSI